MCSIEAINKASAANCKGELELDRSFLPGMCTV